MGHPVKIQTLEELRLAQAKEELGVIKLAKEREKFARDRERLLLVKARLEVRALRRKEEQERKDSERLERIEKMVEGKYFVKWPHFTAPIAKQIISKIFFRAGQRQTVRTGHHNVVGSANSTCSNDNA